MNSRLCAVRLEGAIHKNRQCNTKRCPFVISAYAPPDSNSDNLKDMFYGQLTTLINQSRSSGYCDFGGRFEQSGIVAFTWLGPKR